MTINVLKYLKFEHIILDIYMEGMGSQIFYIIRVSFYYMKCKKNCL